MASSFLKTGAGLIFLLALGTAAEAITREEVNAAQFGGDFESAEGLNPLIVKVQILLDRANASPGVIDGFYGENVAKAISAVETVNELPGDGKLDKEVWSALGGDRAGPALITYEITGDDLAYDFVEEMPEDYGKLAEMDRLAYTSLEEMLAERFHMDIDLFAALNSGVSYSAGSSIVVADTRGVGPDGKARRIEADKAKAQLRAYDAEGRLLVAYPATIGSEENPSPSGTHEVRAIAVNPVYYYRPDKNFQQGDNSHPLDIAPGPNNPVGTVWIDLSEESYGIHGTPEPTVIDKTVSHGCVRLTNWDAEELAELVEVGATVEFLE